MSREATILLDTMMELFRRFAVTHSVNYPNGETEPVALWMNPRAEQEFNRLKEQYDRLLPEEKKDVGSSRNI